MCLAIPAEIVSIEGEMSTVSVGGALRKASLALVPDQVSVGDFVIVHAGFALHKVEAAEAADALLGDDYAHQCEELGDVLLNVMLAVVIAEEEGRFAWRDVVMGVSEKLVRRHPHVFGDTPAANAEEAMRMFLAAKAKEKAE